MYANDVVLVGKSKLRMEVKAEAWCDALEMQWIKISRSKTEWKVMTDRNKTGNRTLGARTWTETVQID